MKKTKRRALYIVAALLAALFVLSCLVGFAACGGSSDDDCADGHTVTSWTTTKEAMCTEAGSRTGTCDVCGETVTEPIDALGHDYVEDSTDSDYRAATCTEDGLKVEICSRCQDKKTETIGKLSTTGEHTYVVDTEKTIDATCTTGGTIYYICEVCGDTSKASDSVAMLGHELVGTYVPATTDGGNTTDASWAYACTVCGEEVVLSDSSDAAFETPAVKSVTLIATDEASLKSAVAWDETDAPLTVKLDAVVEETTEGDDGNDNQTQSQSVKQLEGKPVVEEEEEAVPTITLQSSLVIGSDVTTVAAGDEDDTVKLTLDLNGNTLVYNGSGTGPRSVGNDTIYVKATGDVTIVDTSSDGSGVVDVTGMYSESLCNEGTVTLAGGLFTRSKEDGSDETTNGTDSCYTIENFGTMTIEEGTTVFNAGDYSTCIRSHAASATSEPAKLTMEGGKVYGGKYAVGSGSSGYSDEFLMTGGVLGGLRSETDALPYRALNNYCDATITGGTLLGGNGGAITANPTKADECVEGVVIFNEDGDNNSLTIGDENGNGPEIIYEGINPNFKTDDGDDPTGANLTYYDDPAEGDETTTAFATGIAAYSGEVDINAGSISCSDTNAEREYTFMGVYLTNGTLNVSGGEISGDEALVINCASDEGASVAATITGGTLSGTIIAYAITVDEQLTNPLTFAGYQSAGYTLTTETTGESPNETISRYIYTQGAATGTGE